MLQGPNSGGKKINNLKYEDKLKTEKFVQSKPWCDNNKQLFSFLLLNISGVFAAMYI